MKNLVVSVASGSYFSSSIMNLIYDLGHVIYVSGDLAEPLLELTQSLQIPRIDSGIIASVDLFISARESCALGALPSVSSGSTNILLSITSLPNVHHYEISWIKVYSDGYQILETTQLELAHLINGADIYNEISIASVQSLNVVIATFAQDAAQYTNNKIMRGDIPEQVDLEKIRAWHTSNETQIDYAINHKSLFDAFKTSALQHGDNCALLFEGKKTTYGELLSLSVQVSQFIVDKVPLSNTEPVIVGLALHKSVELYAAILGVLAVGATYVPIDPEYPEDRINNIIKSANPALLITERNAKISTNGLVTEVDISELNLDKNSGLDTECLSFREINSNQPAVIIYTSGSTGTPKGVQLSHKNILYFCAWYKDHVELDMHSRALQFTTVSFDASLLDIFPALEVGAQLIVPNNEERHDFGLLNNLILSSGASHSFIPPAMLGALPDYSWPLMKHIVTGGDVCDARTIEYWSEGRGLHNIYGPTECTVLVSTERFFAKSNNKIIGKPINNTKVYLLNESLMPVTTHEHGELYISGKGVGLGYYGSAQMTAERFIKDPFDTDPQQLMYKTGDTCYWDNSGRIHFVGRKDNQLKIRGFRVELGEIENVILDSKLFKKCTVVANEKKQIRAFVSQPVANATINELEDVLAKSLPYYMLPAHIMALENFPATVNGKIDRVQLLALPIPNQSQSNDEYFNETESVLRTIWAQSLGIDEYDISKSESFFNLGGHSLLVSKMLLAVKNTFPGNFTLARFMESPTIGSLASLLTDGNIQKGDQISDRIYSDMVLDSTIKPLPESNANVFAPKAILLTGANGFLGVHILEELVRQTDAVIYCLIRASSEEYAYKKLYDAYNKYNVSKLVDNARIKAIIGDLDKPLLGLSEPLFSQLAEKIDVIYHNGAVVNHIYDYDYLYNSNVRSTLDLLRLATTEKNKQLVYISTLSAASNISREGRLLEDGPSEDLPAFVNNGYNLTKWVSEQLVWQAHNRGLPITLVRPGNICGHSQTGHCYPDQNRILLLLKGSAQLGSAPNWNANFDLCPVDFIAKGIVVSTTQHDGHVSVLHFHNPMPLMWSEYVNRLNYHNVPVALIPAEEWRKKLFDLDESNALFNVISFYLDEQNEDIGDISNIDHHLTLQRLQQFGMTYPVKDNRLVDANLGFLIRSEFIKPTTFPHRNTTELTDLS